MCGPSFLINQVEQWIPLKIPWEAGILRGHGRQMSQSLKATNDPEAHTVSLDGKHLLQASEHPVCSQA